MSTFHEPAAWAPPAGSEAPAGAAVADLPEPLVSRAEVAVVLGVSASSVRELVRAGELPEIGLGHRSPRYRPADVRALIARRLVANS